MHYAMSESYTNGLLHIGELAEEPEESFTDEYVMSNCHSLTASSLSIGNGKSIAYFRRFLIWCQGSRDALWKVLKTMP
jgi:hypothetical protein